MKITTINILHLWAKIIYILHLWAKIIYILHFSETVAQRCSVKKESFKISQNSQENTCPEPIF